MKSASSSGHTTDDGDWLSFLKTHSSLGLPEVALADMRPAERLIVETLHTRYGFAWQADGSVILTTNRPDRPNGKVRINGCTFGHSSTIKPGALFCGGNLEYLSDDGHMLHRTTSIRSLTLLRRSDA